MSTNQPPARATRGHERLKIPQRSIPNTPESLVPIRGTRPSTKSTTPQPKIPQTNRSLFGFEDIPVDDEKMDDVRFVDIFKAWSRRAIQHSPFEKYASAGGAKKKHLKRIANDLKWAMQADLDEPVAPRPKKAKTQKDIKPQVPITPPAPSAHESKTIDININFGSLPKIHRATIIRTLHTVVRRNKKALGLACIVAILSFGYFIVWPPLHDYATNRSGKNSSLTAKSPDYSTVLPRDRSISDLGGWKRISPANSNPVFAYTDKVDNIAISVSQQPLPETFKTDTSGRIAELAKQFSATDKLDANGTDVYIGTSAKGPQSVIFSKNGLLVLIKSQQKAEDKSWIAYIESLVGTDPSLSNY